MKIRYFFYKILFKIGIIKPIFYINGPETLPAPLKNDEETELLNRNDKESRDTLIVHNLRLVVYIARKFDTVNAGIEDLISIGTIGLIKAVNTFCPERNIKLATYASRCIENEILMFLRFSKKYQNDISLHDPIGTDRDGNEIVMLDVINSNTPDFAEQLDFDIQSEKILKSVLYDLSERERYVIIHRYGLWGHDALTQQEVATHLNISRSYVSRIEKKALKKLKTTLES